MYEVTIDHSPSHLRIWREYNYVGTTHLVFTKQNTKQNKTKHSAKLTQNALTIAFEETCFA